MNSRTFSIRIRSISPFSAVTHRWTWYALARRWSLTGLPPRAREKWVHSGLASRRSSRPPSTIAAGLAASRLMQKCLANRVVARVRRNGCGPMIDGDKVELCAHLAHSAQTAGGRAASTTEQVGYAEAASHDRVDARTACVKRHD